MSYLTPRIDLVRNDTGPQLRLSITNELDGSVTDLTGATVTLHFRNPETGVLLFSRAATITAPNAPLGIAVVQWEAGDLNLTGGAYEGEIEVVLGNGERQTIYDTLSFRLREDFA
jgi:hypothetical protein